MYFCNVKYIVTIGIPVYNAEKYVRQTIESALAQTFESIEFLILDDCGTDSSMSIVREYQQTHPRGKDMRILSQPHNMGVGAARNRIIDEAQGQFLYFMDADDLIEPETIMLLMEYQQRSDADIVYGSYDKIETYNHNRILETHQYPFTELTDEDSLADYAYRKYGVLQTTIWNFLVNIEVLRKAHLRFIDTNFWEDMAFAFVLVTYCRHAILIPNITYHYLCHYHSLSNYQEREQISKEDVVKNILTVEYMKRQCANTKGKIYQSQRCINVLKTDFYILCYILKNSERISPSFTCKELKDIMRHPVSFSEIVTFKHGKLKNILLYLLSKLPAKILVWVVTVIGKIKNFI